MSQIGPCIIVCMPNDPLPPWMIDYALYHGDALETLIQILASIGKAMV